MLNNMSTKKYFNTVTQLPENYGGAVHKPCNTNRIERGCCGVTPGHNGLSIKGLPREGSGVKIIQI
jgi:hypothetical protein